MSYQLIKTELRRGRAGRLVGNFYTWQCYHCKAMAVTCENYEKPPAACAMCKR